MLPKRYRLKRSKDFARVRRGGRFAGSPLVGLYVLPSRTENTRVGFTASKRVGKAVIRNRVKRRLREAVRHRLPAVRPGQDLVFAARAPAANAEYEQIDETVDYLLHKTRAIKRPPEAHNA